MALIAGSTQSVGLFVVVVFELGHFDENADSGGSKFCAAFPSWYILAIFVNIQFKNVQHSGLYKLIQTDDQQVLQKIGQLISIKWLYIGQIANGFACVACAIGSYVIIFQSTEILDMVLNSMALFFMLEIDNTFVSPRDYRDGLKYLQIAKDGHDDEDSKFNDKNKLSSKGKCCANAMYWFYTLVTALIVFMGYFAPFLPIFCG